MLGWIHDCMEKLVIEKFGIEAWHTIKEKSGCTVPDGDFLKVDHYSDESTIAIVVAASEVSGLSVDQVLEAFGVYFVGYIKYHGYDDLIRCQGRTLKVCLLYSGLKPAYCLQSAFSPLTHNAVFLLTQGLD